MTDLERRLLEALRLAVDMRTTQVRYFRATRGSEQKSEALRDSKRLEAQFDKLAARAIRQAEVTS